MRIRYMVLLSLAAVVLTVCLYVIVLAGFRGRVSKCPRCRSTRLRPSWPSNIDKFLLSVSHVMPYRCEACLKRFYALEPRVMKRTP